jgi:hypothetical protein
MEQIVLTVVGGIGILIFAYLLFSNGKNATSLLNAGGSNTTSLVKALQGR